MVNTNTYNSNDYDTSANLLSSFSNLYYEPRDNTNANHTPYAAATDAEWLGGTGVYDGQTVNYIYENSGYTGRRHVNHPWMQSVNETPGSGAYYWWWGTYLTFGPKRRLHSQFEFDLFNIFGPEQGAVKAYSLYTPGVGGYMFMIVDNGYAALLKVTDDPNGYNLTSSEHTNFLANFVYLDSKQYNYAYTDTPNHSQYNLSLGVSLPEAFDNSANSIKIRMKTSTEFDHNLIQVFINDTLYLSGKDYQKTYTSGFDGIGSVGNVETRFFNIKSVPFLGFTSDSFVRKSFNVTGNNNNFSEVNQKNILVKSILEPRFILVQ